VTDLPSCQWRRTTLRKHHVICLHDRIHMSKDSRYVPRNFCSMCKWREKPLRVGPRYPRWSVGNAISAAFSWFNIKKKEGCGCEERQSRFNRWHMAVWQATLKLFVRGNP